jgi:hypothetical protein
MESGYIQEPIEAGRVRFTVTPALVSGPRAIPLGLALVGALAASGVTAAFTGASQLVAPGAIALGCGWWVHRASKRWLSARSASTRSRGGTFVVSAAGIEASGGQIARDQLRGLAVRNADGAKPGDASYLLCADTSVGTTTLAGGMSRSTAQGLLADVSRIVCGRREASRDGLTLPHPPHLH